MIRAFLAALLLALAGCASAPIPHQTDAFAIVWNQTYGRHDGGPNVQWIQGDDLDCFPDPQTGAYRGFYAPRWYGGPATAMCDGGLTWVDINLSQVALYPPLPYFKFSSSAYAHELNHVRCFLETGNSDYAHTGPSWQPGGLVEQANDALRAAGL